MSNKPHPEDEIYKVKTFINELQKVQEEYFTKLVENLNLSKEGEDWLFDYIHNSDKNEFDDFQHYLNDFNKKYEDMIKKDGIFICPQCLTQGENFMCMSCDSTQVKLKSKI